MGQDLDARFPREGPARHCYYLRCELPGGAWLKRLRIANDLQMAPLALPGLVVGENRLEYTDESTGERAVRITHEWAERSASAPPAAPVAAVSPANGGEVEGTGLVFAWVPAIDANGEAIADYHFELSEYADMRWPLSSNFRKLISNTADQGRAQYTLPQVGLLAPDRTYYWRVRAQNESGVWGAWSETWSFVARAPGPPVEVTLGDGTLRWRPNPEGRVPAKYRVYGSDEKGFSVSDEPYAAMDFYAGDWRGAALRGRFEANFVAEVEGTELIVVGAGLTFPNANRAFYRVLAVDAQGNRSGPSGYVAAPRPFISTTPVTTARVGETYRYQVATIRSRGDLGLRDASREQVPDFWPPEEQAAILEGPGWFLQVANFWDVEEPRYALLEGPAWLTIDAATGLLTGVPDAAGAVRVVVAAVLRREVQELDLERLAWGQREVTGTTVQEAGPARQEFTVTVSV